MTATIHRFPAPAIRCIESVSPVRAQAEKFMRSLRAHQDAGKVPDHLFLALVDVLDAVVLRVERAEASNAGR